MKEKLFASILAIFFCLSLNSAFAQNAPLTDLTAGNYLGQFERGLYPGRTNNIPQDHFNNGLTFANEVKTQLINGKKIMMSVGFSNATHEFCDDAFSPQYCKCHTFVNQAKLDSELEFEPVDANRELVILDGAIGGQGATEWVTNPNNYTRMHNNLTHYGYTASQVRTIWFKQAEKSYQGEPSLNSYNPSNPNPNIYSLRLLKNMGIIVRNLKNNFPNLKMIFASTRIYGGNATGSNQYLNPEPYAYENGHAIKWLIEAQIRQMRGEDLSSHPILSLAGDLKYDPPGSNTGAPAPWISWGPYMWADGNNPLKAEAGVYELPDHDGDGNVVSWQLADFAPDGQHPSKPNCPDPSTNYEKTGVGSVGRLLHTFFKTSPLTQPWFLLNPPQTDTIPPAPPTSLAVQ